MNQLRQFNTACHLYGRIVPRRCAGLPGFAIMFVSMVVTLSGLAQEPMSPHHVARIKLVTSASISPDGKQIAYTLSVPRDALEGKDGRAYGELHVVSAKGESRPFVTGEVNVSSVRWTPTGDISFLSRRSGDEQTSLYVIPSSGGEARRVLQFGTSISAYSWSPDGSRVAFIAKEVEDKDKKEWSGKGFDREIYEEEFSMSRVWIASVDGVSTGDPKQLKLTGHASSLQWGPSGDFIAVALAPTPLVDDHYMRRLVHIVDAESGAMRARFHHPAKLGSFECSPDGKHVVTVSGEDINDPKDGRLLLWSVDGKKISDLIPDYEGHVSSAIWVDSKNLVVVGDEGTQTSVKKVSIDGSVKTMIEPGGPVIGSVSLSDDGKTAGVIAQSPTHPGEVFSLDTADGDLDRLTDSNSWLMDIKLAKQEIVKHKARDGQTLEGILVRPVEEKPGQRYPLILAVHGGPESHVKHGWITSYSLPGHVAAARGIAVFYPNYRGSTGRGVAFSKMGQADAAGKEFDDLVDAVDHLVKTGLVDKSKVGITGGSYGGYASAWGATYYSERFAASVMFVGISDNLSKVGTTDIPNEMYHVHHRKWFWDDVEYFLKRSPIYYVKKAQTPLLILHGKEDPRVHPSQSMELYRHLKTLGKTPVRLVFYPGEGHGNRRAASRLDYNLRMLRWMEHYLKGDGGDPPQTEINYRP